MSEIIKGFIAGLVIGFASGIIFSILVLWIDTTIERKRGKNTTMKSDNSLMIDYGIVIVTIIFILLALIITITK